MANSNSKAAEQAEQALRKLLLNMRNETKANHNHTQALANFKAAVQAYNKAQMNAAKASLTAIEDPTVRNVSGAAGALGNVLNTAQKLKRSQSVLREAARTPVNTVPKGENNSKVTRKNTGKKQRFLERVAGGARFTGGAIRGLFQRRPVSGKTNNAMRPLLEPNN